MPMVRTSLKRLTIFGSQKKYRLVVFKLDFAPTERRTDVFDTNLLLIRFDRNVCLLIFTKWILNPGLERRLDWKIFSFLLSFVELNLKLFERVLHTAVSLARSFSRSQARSPEYWTGTPLSS